MRKFGLVGYPLTHSFSKKYFEEKFKREKIFDCSYDLFPLSVIDNFLPLLKTENNLHGLNVTIPYKESVINLIDELDETAKLVGAVNCITLKNEKPKGYNTDAYGFKKSLEAFLIKQPEQTFVLGTGGSSKAVCFVLQQMQIPFLKVSREPKEDVITYKEIQVLMKKSNLFINTTPLGMFPQTDFTPEIPYSLLSKNDALFDLIYNPQETLFLKKGKNKNAKTKNGLEMLELQAEKSWEIWNA